MEEITWTEEKEKAFQEFMADAKAEDDRIEAMYSDPKYQGPEWTWTGTGWIRSSAVDWLDLQNMDWPAY